MIARFKFLLIVCLTVALLFFAGLVGYAYVGQDGKLAGTILNRLPMPIGVSGSQIVRVTDLSVGKAVATRSEYSSVLRDYHTAISYSKLLQKIKFERQRCEMFKMSLDVCLEYAWIYDKNLNKETYVLAESLVNKILAGSDFAQLAFQYSQDDATRVFDGDAGFVGLAGVLPEFGEKLSAMSKGETGIIASRHGLHIIQVTDVVRELGSGETLYRINEIFLEPKGYEIWLAKEQKDLRLWSFVD